MATPISEFYYAIRAVTGDNDSYGVFENTDQTIDQAIRAAVNMGMVPGFAVQGDASIPTIYSIAPDVSPGKNYMLVVLQTSWLMASGSPGGYSYSTRALSERFSGDRQKAVIAYCIQTIFNLRDADAVFSTTEKIVNFVNALGDIGDLMQINALLPSDITLDYSAGIIQPAIIQ